MEEECAKCKKKKEDFPEWKTKKVYLGLDLHHNPPEFISDYLEEKWSGEKFYLCRECHKKLHFEIKKIMFKYSNLFKPKNNEYWLWMNITPSNRKIMVEEIIKFTREWINDNTNT